MNAVLLLLAAALCVAPWQGAPAERLRELTAARSQASAPARRGELSHRAASVAHALTRFRRRAAGPAGTEPLARTLDLLAVALLAGLPTHLALVAVADAVDPTDPDVAAPLRAAAARIRLGATPAEAWRNVPGTGRLAPVAPVLARAIDGGGSVRSALDHAARRLRSDADAAATARAERAAVLVAGPLGLCFLPAFVCLGVVPVVVGLADGMLPEVLP